MKPSRSSSFWHLPAWAPWLTSIRQGTLGTDEEVAALSEIFTADQMARHGVRLARQHKLSSARGEDILLKGLKNNETVLVSVWEKLCATAAESGRTTPAGEWLLDNFYLVEEHVRIARQHLPAAYSRELPRLLEGASAGMPRVYDIAIESISHADGRVDMESLRRLVEAYQTVEPLKLGELWAIPIMLRLALIEKLAGAAVRIERGHVERDLADRWADTMIATAENDPKNLIVVIADMARSDPPLGSAFVAELARRLQGRSPSLSLPLTWVEQHLAESGLSIEQLVRRETRGQAADQVLVSNSIGSLRELGALDWRAFVEAMSLVEHTLATDPSGDYAKMDFASRDRYRHAVEELARRASLPELDVARKAVELAAQHADDAGGEPASHIGYHLLDAGRARFEHAVGARMPWLARLRARAGHLRLLPYLGSIVLLTVALTAALLFELRDHSPWWIVLLSVPMLLATSQLVVTLVNWVSTLLVAPQPLQRMDFSRGIPAEFRTLVVVPSLLSHPDGVESLIDALEVRYLANRDEQLFFGLLTDFVDAADENMPEDDSLLQLAARGIETLNAKYRDGEDGFDRFYLFHRPRRWNPVERVWMGHERKRGKLADLNRLLRGAGAGEADPAAAFSLIVGGLEPLYGVRYVITLDTDTGLPHDSAWQLVGNMAHPLNRPRLSQPSAGRASIVGGGHAILQPRVGVSLSGANRSRYARLFAGDAGIDPYTRAVSDVYQDLFGQGSFIGKGIYDVDAFEQAVCGCFPENRILSHDLLEGCYARSALVNDVVLYETHPSRYLVDVARRHRWIRGDWQIASWMLPRVPTPDRSEARNPLPALARWKIVDNLRRSLVAPSIVVLLLAAWIVPSIALPWTLALLGIYVVPALASYLVDLLRPAPQTPLARQFMLASSAALRHLKQALFAIACLPYEARFHLDAVARAQWRTLVTRRRLLEWRPSEIVEDRLRRSGHADAASDLWRSYRAMKVQPLLAAGSTAWLAAWHPSALPFAAPVLVAWLAGPAFAWWLSRPLEARVRALAPDQIRFLRMLSRRTWAYFERFVDARNHWLPPDNYQEAPVERVAHRTSPTNMGFALLANLSAYDLGYITAGALLERTSNALATMHSLERYRGHLYNWYDTQTLEPLLPTYVSSVDSGNLCALLLTLRPGLAALADEPILARRTLEGLHDTWCVLLETTGSGARAAPVRRLGAQLARAREAPPTTLDAARRCLAELAASADECVAAIAAANDEAASIASSQSPPESGEALADRGEASAWRETSAQHEASTDRESERAEVEGVNEASRSQASGADALPNLASELAATVGDDVPLHPHAVRRDPGAEALRWARALSRQCHGALEELYALAVSRQGAQEANTELPNGELAGDGEPIPTLREAAAIGSEEAAERLECIERLLHEAADLADLDYRFLYDENRRLLSIGYNVDERRTDASYYDLLASEARLASFVAIAQRRLPTEHWFALGRLLTHAGGDPILVAWSGSMFEYLMPQLLMPRYENSLLDQTCQAAVERQIDYGRERGVPWGISESGYSAVDTASNYQYRAFGVPGLGLKRGLAEDLVIAPYASALALLVDPLSACRNLQRLWSQGLAGEFGLYEAVDMTPARLPPKETSTVVRSFMAHHHGMSLLAIESLLLDQPMQRRFASDPNCRGALLLLQERVPKVPTFHRHTTHSPETQAGFVPTEMPIRVISDPDVAPQVQLLSNGRYHVMVTHAGGGYSRWNDLAVTRWQEDPTRDHWGSFCFVRDVSSDVWWSTAYQPSLRRADHYEAIFTEGRAEFRRRDRIAANDPGLETHTEIVVSPEDDIELRRISITNRSRRRRTIELTTYAEVVLAPAVADALHPAFSNLFVQTEFLDAPPAILCTRRPRSPEEHAPWMFHLMAVHGARAGPVTHETDRARFVGRGHGLVSPQAMRESGPLGGGHGSVLDPIVASRCTVVLDADETAIVDVVTGVAGERAACVALIEKYADRRLTDRVFKLAWSHSQVVLRQLGATEVEAQLYAHLASAVVYATPALRAESGVLLRNRRGQSDLWGYAISGDLPIVLLTVSDSTRMPLVREMIQAHAYWRLKGLSVDLVIWNEEHDVYRQQLQENILGLIPVGVGSHVIDRPGGIFVRYASQISREDRILIQSVARAIIADDRGGLAEQLARRVAPERRIAPLVPTARASRSEAEAQAEAAPRELLFDNGYGGFSRDGREYIVQGSGGPTPAPWSNVLANPVFGTVVTESGAAYTWFENAHEFRLTPWHNDPLGDPSGETFYLRDEETGRFWSPTSLPSDGAASCTARHGFGYTVYERSESGIESELCVYVALDAAVKFSVLRVRNASGRARRLSATGYVEWVLGDLRSKSAMHVSTAVDPHSGALLARNRYNADFSGCIAFLHVGESFHSATCDRTEFIGHNGTLRRPAAMRQLRLSGRTGAGFDPCAAIQVPFELADGQEREIVFRLGVAHDADEGHRLIDRFRGSSGAREALEVVHAYWGRALGAVQVHTPDAALDVLANGWLTYQALACRVWARSGYYQSGGAFGFRDQLQDVMALVHAEPALMREHLLRCASRQFVEGDVQHWWHPPSGRGVRTQCSDDYLWLPLATCRYVNVTGDRSVLEERAPFLEGRAVNPGEDSYYDLPVQSSEEATLYRHCMLAIRHGLRFGPHGLPLIGTGDWNDGMNLVGIEGHGESVWLGFFLCDLLRDFAVLAREQRDDAFAELCDAEATALTARIEQHAWDGNWYRRAYFDDGTPLGSAANEQCRIDSIAQSWSVLSHAGDRQRAARAMRSLDAHLVNREARLVQLLDPPFDRPHPNPGYIAGYAPGVRENGGQYTHAAIWAVMAFAEMGDVRRAWELFDLINPVTHGSTRESAAVYRAEPYIVTADVYAVPPHTGRGGWSWYTGSAGWMYRLIVESLLGLRVRGETLELLPCLPGHWDSFELLYRHRETPYRIRVRATDTSRQLTVDDVVSADGLVQLVDDRREHRVLLEWPRPDESAQPAGEPASPARLEKTSARPYN